MPRLLFEPIIWDVVSLVICGSIVAHGLTGAPLSRLYGRKTGARKEIARQALES